VRATSFEQWWEPFTLGVGPAGSYVDGLTPEHRQRPRERCRELLPEPPFGIDAMAWTVLGAPG
jgi:hypothetical protein